MKEFQLYMSEHQVLLIITLWSLIICKNGQTLMKLQNKGGKVTIVGKLWVLIFYDFTDTWRIQDFSQNWGDYNQGWAFGQPGPIFSSPKRFRRKTGQNFQKNVFLGKLKRWTTKCVLTYMLANIHLLLFLEVINFNNRQFPQLKF